jgi:site-specific recombinase XerD
MKKGQTYPVETLTTAEVRQLLAACTGCSTGIRNKAMLAILWRGGLRCSEMLALQPRDVADDGKVNIRHGKGNKQRTVAIDGEAKALLDCWMERKARHGIGGPIFSTLLGQPLQASYVRALLPRLARKAGITKRVHAHALRHSYASGLADEKLDIRLISRALGHSSVAVTGRYIDHLNPTALLDALKARVW